MFLKEEREFFSRLPRTLQLLIKIAFKWSLAWLIGGVILYLLFLAMARGETVSMVGLASWYGGGEKLNKYTASGEVFDPEALTCAIWDWPLGTYLKVTNLASGYEVIVRVNDRGPARRLGRLIDLTRHAFSEIADPRLGLIKVKVEIWDPGHGGN